MEKGVHIYYSVRDLRLLFWNPSPYLRSLILLSVSRIHRQPALGSPPTGEHICESDDSSHSPSATTVHSGNLSERVVLFSLVQLYGTCKDNALGCSSIFVDEKMSKKKRLMKRMEMLKVTRMTFDLVIGSSISPLAHVL
ncbi:hypothetical protein DM860_016335 [Cuscuta australis]|uniref:Uncharacterized protein n=1 Tax=Cuscuta australis TaxID=267555 RepID=A0A328D9W4_9ASTE|nr:hypothetical protein DM860_016335 [Cuscuta australis]